MNKAEKKNTRNSVRKWAKQQKRMAQRNTLATALWGLVGTCFAIGQAYNLARFLSVLLIEHKGSLSALLYFSFFTLGRVFLTSLQEISALRAGQAARQILRKDLLTRLLGIGPVLLRHQHSAEITELLVDRIEALDGYFSRWLPASALWLVTQWGIVLVVFWQNPHAGLILGICCLLLPIFQAIFGIATAVASRKQFLALSRLQTRFLDRIKGISTIVLGGNIEHEIATLGDNADSLRKRTMKVLRIAFLASATTDIAMIAALIGVVISQAHLLHHANTLQNVSSSLLSKAIFAVLMVPEAFVPIRMLSAAYQDRAQAQAMVEASEKLPPQAGYDEKHKDRPDTSWENPPKARQYPERTPKGISLSVENISYSWAEDRPPALSHISFSLKAGEIMLLDGASGAGKSTLIELLLGFIRPSEGKILLGGVDVTNISPIEQAHFISWIAQKPVLFAGTLRENILFAKPEATEEELNIALEAAHVTSYLPSLPYGLDTPIGEGGFGLSGGQAQRIAIARAYLKNAPLLLLDEPTAHLDPQTEDEVLEALQILLEGRTALISTHSSRYNIFSESRRLSLEKGHIV